MKSPNFSYLRAESVQQAIDGLARFNDGALVLAGGQSLMPMLNLRIAQAKVLVDINRIAALSTIREHEDHIEIGALARYSDLQTHPLVRAHLPLFTAALPHVAHPAIRNRGTLGGSLALADPAAELPACCLALDARVVLACEQGEREVAIHEWFRGLYETAIAANELLIRIRVPKQPPGQISQFFEVARRRGDFAQAGIALTTSVRDGIIVAPRLALLGVADRPVLAHATQSLIDDQEPQSIEHDQLADALDTDSDPLHDPMCSAAYRRHALNVLMRRALQNLRTMP